MISQKVTDYLIMVYDYRVLLLSGVLLFGLSTALPTISLSPVAASTCQQVLLCMHESTPWGVVTSILLYDGWQNAPTFFALILTYVSFGTRVSSAERRGRAMFATSIGLGGAIAANAMWLAILPRTYSWGPSGVVYSVWGVMLAFALMDGLPRNANTLDPRTWYSGRAERSFAVSNLAIFASTVLIIFMEPQQFLSAGPNVNVFAHGVSFLLGYFATTIYQQQKT